MRPGVRRITLCLVVPTLTIAGALGCVKRKETITVASDGGVAMRLEFDADSFDELNRGDAVPSAAGGWKVAETTRTDTDSDTGKNTEHFLLTAEQSFAPGESLPAGYADPGDDSGLYLDFPTALTVENRPDGRYYHFRRAYPARRLWADLEASRKRVIEPLTEPLDAVPAEEWSQQDWSHMVRGLTQAEIAKMTMLARAAFIDAFPKGPQDVWLRMKSGIDELEGEMDFDAIASLVAQGEGEIRTQAIEAMADDFDARAVKRMVSVLVEAGSCRPDRVAAFEERYRWYERYHEISEDLADDAFEIVVEMPGEIVAANSDEITGNRVRWTLDGEVLRDGGWGRELLVTSRVRR